MEKILISACLMGTNCKYDGLNNLNVKLLSDLKDYELIPVCPEVDGGLSTPRKPSERVGDKVLSIEGVDVTSNYNLGARIALDTCKKNNIKYAILKAKSPSCGAGIIYDGTFTHTPINGDGVTAELLKLNGIEVYNEINYVELLKKISK